MRDLGGGNKSMSVRTAAMEWPGSCEPAAAVSFHRNHWYKAQCLPLPIWLGSGAVGYR